MTPPQSDLDARPRILCLHGGGTNAEIFTMQSRSFIRSLPEFRLVFADAPFFCGPGPGIAGVYDEYGPFRRWLRWLPEDVPIEDEAATEEVMYSIKSAQAADIAGTGPWVGLLGFSQGAKLAASLLYDQQIRVEKDGKADTDYKFGVIFAGRNPLVSFCEHSRGPSCVQPGTMTEGFDFKGTSPHILRIPSIHVHGLEDPGIELHRKLLHQYCDPATSILFEWDGGHRMPIKTADVEPITREIYRIARENGLQV